MEEWKECRLGDICKTNINSYSEKYNWSFVNYLDTGNITENKISDIQFIDLSSESLPSRARRKVQLNDIIYSTVRPNQKHFGIIKNKPENFLVSTGFAVLHTNKTIADPNFIFYNLIQNENTESLHAIAEQTTSAYPAIKPSDIENLSIKLPPLPTQQKIAAILSSLDDKIELNNKINTNLEQQAQALFKNWFVDFEPFGGKMPEGWKEVSLNDVCLKITDGSHYSPKDDEQAEIPMLSVKDMEKYGFNTKDCKHINEEEFNKMLKNDCVPQVNDILIAKDGSYLKEIFICNKFEKLAILSSIAIFRPNTKIIYPEILLTLLKSPRVMKEVKDNYVSGSALPRIVLKDFKKLKFFIPNISEQSKLAKILSEIRFQIYNNVKENQNLSELRDTLLPKLMNGEFVI